MSDAALKRLAEETLKRFPELREMSWYESDDSVDGIGALLRLGEWLAEQSDYAAELLTRIRDFDRWCADQPGGTDASNDIFSMLIVSFHEELFKHENTRKLLPVLLPREELVEHREYYVSWVGQENYDLALKLFPED